MKINSCSKTNSADIQNAASDSNDNNFKANDFIDNIDNVSSSAERLILIKSTAGHSGGGEEREQYSIFNNIIKCILGMSFLSGGCI